MSPATLKAKCNRSHACRRARERYGRDWSPARVREIEESIRAGSARAVPLRPTDHPHRVYYAVLDGRDWLPVLYDTATRSLLTVLPPQALDDYRAALGDAACLARH